MTFAPVVPIGGLAGWKFLSRTEEAQRATLARDPAIRRDVDYFRARIGAVTSADQLVSDRRLLAVALGAFGLDADINNRAFIRKVLDDGTLTAGALSNKLADKRYLEFSKAFGFGDFAVPRTQLSDFADKIVAAYQARQFETAVGTQDGDLRLALNARRELATLAARPVSENARWFAILGSAPLRQVFQSALGLPQSFAAIDIDQQLSVLKDRAGRMLGDSAIAQFADPDKVDGLIRRFLLRSQSQGAGAGPASGQSAALALLQAGNTASGGLLSIRR